MVVYEPYVLDYNRELITLSLLLLEVIKTLFVSRDLFFKYVIHLLRYNIRGITYQTNDEQYNKMLMKTIDQPQAKDMKQT